MTPEQPVSPDDPLDAGGGPPASGVDAGPAPHTLPEGGDAVGTALLGLDGLADLPVAEHVPRFEAVHAALTDALAAIDRA